jgi:hypothetical protein
MSPIEPVEVTCCFCGGDLELERATQLVVVPPGEDVGNQILYCHGNHLKEAIHATVLLMPEVTDEQ